MINKNLFFKSIIYCLIAITIVIVFLVCVNKGYAEDGGFCMTKLRYYCPQKVYCTQDISHNDHCDYDYSLWDIAYPNNSSLIQGLYIFKDARSELNHVYGRHAQCEYISANKQKDGIILDSYRLKTLYPDIQSPIWGIKDFDSSNVDYVCARKDNNSTTLAYDCPFVGLY